MKLSSIILSFVVLIQSFNFDIDDFSRLSNFVTDINCHIKSGEGLTGFMVDHYSNTSNLHEHEGNSHDHENHGKLPFKHQHSDNHLQIVFVFFSNEYPSQSEDFLEVNKNFNYKEPSTNLVLHSFFQPPRV
jgi:hypothetical protein